MGINVQLIRYLSWLIPSISKRQDFKKQLYKKFIIKRLPKRYEKVLNKLKNKIAKNPNYKIKILFLVNENQKWCSQELFEEFKRNNLFETYICLSKINPVFTQFKTPEEAKYLQDEEFLYFKNIDDNAIKLYDSKYNDLDLKDFSPDIVFYQQFWGVKSIHTPAFVSDFALTCYIPYGIQILNNPDNYMTLFHATLWKYFVESEINLERFSTEDNPKNCIVTGYPKMDVYLKDTIIKEEELWKISKEVNPEIKRVIYAPHFSFSSASSNVSFATFRENGEFLLEYAKNHSEIEWLFKPHPRLKTSLVTDGIMTEEEAQKYYQAWDEMPNGKTYDKGSYFDFFKTSDALITDCVSFLAEYLPTKKPVFFLKSKEHLSFNQLGEKIVENYYNITNVKELEDMINKVLINGDDLLHDKRISAIKYLEIEDKSASEKIVEYLEKELGKR